jgi:predicted metal-dependent phosphoesterase TrpH
MQFSDLHVHSKFSDGMLWPREIISIASTKGIKCISITDHDTIDSQLCLGELSQEFNIISIPGIELSTEYKEREIHILGYFIDIHNTALQEALNNIEKSRIKRAKDIIEKLNNLNIKISYDEVLFDGTSVGRPHIAKVLVSKGYSENIKEAFQQYLIKGKPAYVDRYKLSYKEALNLINNCNGISVLAHPGEVYKGIQIDEIIKEFKIYGLKGIEVFHPSHTSKQTNDYYNLAKKYSLAISGGSDYHGINYDSDTFIGSYGLDEKLIEKFLRLGNIK